MSVASHRGGNDQKLSDTPVGRAHQTGRANQTFEPIEPPWQAIREWIPDDDAEPCADLFDQRPASGKPVEIRREDGTILVLDGD